MVDTKERMVAIFSYTRIIFCDK